MIVHSHTGRRLRGSQVEDENCGGPILVSLPGDRRRGLPLGSETSQFFANVYLDPFDHFVKEVLRRKGYIGPSTSPSPDSGCEFFRPVEIGVSRTPRPV